MRRNDVLPYLAAPTDAINPRPWFRWVGEELQPLGDYISDWDQNTILYLESTLTADLDAVSSSTGLSKSDLAWSIGWRAMDSFLVGPTKVLPVESEAVSLSLEIPPEHTGNVIQIRRGLILMNEQSRAGFPLRAHLPGSVLWRDDFNIRLSGAGAAFPVEVIDFGKLSGLARLARNSWYLELPASVDTPTLGGLLLMINSADKALVAAVSSLTPDEEQKLLVNAMQESVVQQIVRWALARWQLLPESVDASVGSAARVLTERVLVDPQAWTESGVSDMDLHAAIIEGSRRINLGRSF